MKVGNFFAFALIGAACLSASCGGSTNGSTLLQQNDQPQLKDAAPAPDGVEPELWHSLLAELDRSIAFAPKLEPARVTNLELEWLPDGQVQARWEYNNPGDYDLNGVVNVSDLVPVGKHFGATAAQESWPAACVADGDGNGVVSISDITPIGAGFGNIVDAYYVLAGEEDPPDLTYNPGGENGEVVATVALAAAVVPPEGGLPVFSARFPQHLVYSFYWVAPVDEDVTYSGFDDIGIGGERLSIGTDMRGDWYMQYRDAGHSNRSALPGPMTNYINWQLDIPGAEMSQPVYNTDGLIFVGAADGLHAVNSDGTRAWIYATEGPVTGAAAVGRTGAVYFGCDDGWLRAVSPQGDLLWSSEGGGPISTGVAVADDGTVYSASGAGELLAVSPAGELLWKYPSPGEISDTPSIGQDGAIYAATRSSQTLAVTDNGVDRWENPYINSSGSYSDSTRWSPVLAVYPTYSDPIDDFSDYYLGEVALLARSKSTYGGRLSMFPIVDDSSAVWDLTTPWWDYSLAPETPLPPAVREDYSLLVPLRESALTAYGLETNQLWTFEYPTHNVCDCPVSLSTDGDIYLSVYNHYDQWKVASLFALDSVGDLLWQLEFEAASLSQPVIAPDYTLYVVSSEGVLYAIGGGAYNSAPQAPPSLTADGYSASKIELSWESSAGAGGYEVFRDSQDDPIAQLAGQVLNYTDEELEPGSIHTYWIHAVNYYGASGFSEPATASTSMIQPQDFAASDGLYSDRIVLTWTKSQNATGYVIYRDTEFTHIVPATNVGDVAEWHDSGVTDWDEHTYYIRANNSLVTSFQSSDTGRLQRGTGDTGAGDWRQYGHDAAHTFCAGVAGPGTTPDSDSVVFDPNRYYRPLYVKNTVFGSQGCQYVVTSGDGIFALHPDGSHRWHVEGGRCAAVLNDGAVAAADPSGLVIYNPDGTIRSNDPEIACLALALHPSQDLIVSEYTAVTRFNPLSGEVWSYEFPEEDGSPARDYPVAVASDGTVYVCAASRLESPIQSPAPWGSGQSPPVYRARKLIALGSDGAKLWEFLQYGELGPPAVGQDGSILVASGIGLTYVVAPDGVLKRTIPLTGALSIAQDGAIVIGQYGGKLYKLDSTGYSVIWEFEPADDVTLYGCPVIDSTGTVFIAHKYAIPGDSVEYAGVIAVNTGGQLLWRHDTHDRQPQGLSIGNDGTLWLNTKTEVDGRDLIGWYSLKK